MAKFRVTDTQSGRSVVVSGDSAPSEQEAEEIFNAAGLRQTPGKSTTQQGADILRTVGLGILPDTGANLLDIGKGVVSGKRIDPNNPTGYDNPLRTPDQLTEQFGGQGHGEQLASGYKQLGKDTAGLLSWLIPIGGSIKTAMGLGATAGGLSAASQEGASPGSIATGVGAGAIAGPVFKGATELAGKATSKVGEKVTEAGEQLVLRGLKPSPSQLTRFKERTGKDLADWLNNQGIQGNFSEEAGKRIEALQAQFDDLAIHSGIKVPLGKLQQLFIKRMEAMKDSVVPSVKAKAEDLKTIMENLGKKYGDSIDVADLTKERRQIDAFLKDSQFNMPVEQSNFLRAARDAIQESIQELTKGQGPKDLKTIGLELRDLFEFQRIAEKQSNLGRGTNWVGLLKMLGAGTGGMVAGLPGIAGGIAVTAATQSPRVISAASRGLQAGGDAIQGAGQAAMKGRFEALQRALRNLSANQMSKQQLP